MSQSDDFKSLEWPFKDPKFIFFTDFDGTITLQDSNDYMTDTIGFGKEIREGLNRDILDGKITFRDAFRQMMDSVKKPFPECVEYLVKNIKLDPHFNEYYQWALKNQIPTVIVSSGMQPIIRAVLKNLVGDDADKLTIVCNEPEARPGKKFEEEGGWQIKYHDDSGFGHDKSLTLRPYANLPADKRPTLFYAGDGVSDLSAARETDLLFAKKGRDLIKYCAREEVPFTVFEDWSSILATVQDIVAGKKSVQQAADEGYKAYKEGGAGLNGAAK
ncbi:hypothetical protein KC367_g3608 [Hortaea werneckii]|uniref:Uncharacterized protein n=2 Tax=Hortaea werneckii TaxID=91943 RepID=A0A3M7J028_HORWE|nr:hypothetical protein KC358_g9845 [Hortaea werneckii]OTA33522.1 hypothetical protein BTJ68_06493 [Hortaea werneckii EXF-2000]KAI6824248.1 hypothetical protein KC350_g9045 [Hortaea werneckii]KAI6921967.1 hypothetical protein KC348_g9960 [Hortaea werneckii]KAI6965942.1 hypothetical protein KC321_g9840 [Hortaea werneckii]